MSGHFLVAADAGVEETAALVFDGDYVAVRVPVGALEAGGQVDAVDLWGRCLTVVCRHEWTGKAVSQSTNQLVSQSLEGVRLCRMLDADLM